MAVDLVPLRAGSADLVDAAVSVTRDSDAESDVASAAALRAQLGSPDTVMGSSRLAMVDGHPEGMLIVERTAGSDTVFLDVRVRGDRAIDVAAALLRAGLERADGLGGVSLVQASADENDSAMAAALADAGFLEVRRFWRMWRPLGEGDATEPAPPQGVARHVVSGPEDLRILHALREASFEGTYGFESRAFENYVEVLDSPDHADPEGWWIATLDDRPVGLCVLDDSHADRGDAYIRTVGVIPEARGRGIGRWLLGCAAAYAVRGGRHRIGLTVDGRNDTGATDLYLSEGYEALEIVDLWERPSGNAAVSAASR